jgi:hypothetical protein
MLNHALTKNNLQIPGEDKKEAEKKKKEEMAALFKPVVQTVPKGVDPKSVVCVYFKQGLCQKGDKCKFSHDLNQERKAEKRSIYDDTRNEQGGMENWDEKELEDVVNQKHGEDNKKKNTTQIVCKYFIEAVENKTYGWFWSCPNGETCMYRHALPPGFTLKSDMKKKDGESDELSLEMLIEKERAALGPNVTKITLESFLAWKKRKIQEKKDERIKQDEKKRTDFKLGFMNGLTGRDIFTFNPDMVSNDDDSAGNDIDYRHREREEGEEGEEGAVEIREVSADFFASQAREVDNTGTVAADDRFSYIKDTLDRQKREAEAAAAAIQEEEEPPGGDQPTTSNGGAAGNIEIDESLFNADEIADELDELDLDEE